MCLELYIEKSGVVVIRFREAILAELESEAVGSILVALVIGRSMTIPRIVLDFTLVQFFGAAVIGQLVFLYSTVRQHQGQLVFCNMTPDIAEMFNVTNRSLGIPVVTDLSAALAQFKRDAHFLYTREFFI
jgi:anti-anti-sigma factor